MILPPVTPEYEFASQAIMNEVLTQADEQNLKLNRDNFLSSDSAICLQNGAGDWFKLGVNTPASGAAAVITLTKLAGTQLDANGRPVLASSNPYTP